MGTYLNGMTPVTTTATLICTVPAEDDGVLIQNNGTVTVYLGGPDVTSSGATQGVGLAAAAALVVPSVGGTTNDLYGVVVTGSADVTWLMPQE